MLLKINKQGGWNKRGWWKFCLKQINGVDGKILLKLFIKYVALSVALVFLRAFKGSCTN